MHGGEATHRDHSGEMVERDDRMAEARKNAFGESFCRVPAYVMGRSLLGLSASTIKLTLRHADCRFMNISPRWQAQPGDRGLTSPALAPTNRSRNSRSDHVHRRACKRHRRGF